MKPAKRVARCRGSVVSTAIGGGPARRAPILLLLSSLLLFTLAIQPAGAQRGLAGTEGGATHRIERIELGGLSWVSPEILRAESLLDEGADYTDAEIRDAVYRIVRLPFVLGAEYALEPGDRGGEVLVLTVREGRKWFFGVDSDNRRWAEPISVDGLERSEWVGTGEGEITRRFRAGRRGMFRLGLGGLEGGLEIGYSHHGLLGRGARLELSFSQSFCSADREGNVPQGSPEESCETYLVDLGLDPAFSTWSDEGNSRRAAWLLSVPIRGNRAVRFRGAWRSSERGFRRPAYEPNLLDTYDFDDLEQLGLAVEWSYDSTDDPVVPSRGSAITAGLEYRTTETELASLSFPFREGQPPGALPGQLQVPVLFTEMDSRETRAAFSGVRFWPLARRQSLWLEGRAAVGAGSVRGVPLPGRRVVEDDLDTLEGRLGIGHAFLILRSVVQPRWRELRWETAAEALYSGTSPDFDLLHNPASGFWVGTGPTYRNTWGVFRFRIGYIDLG